MGDMVMGRVLLGTWYIVLCHRVDALKEGLGGLKVVSLTRSVTSSMKLTV